MHATRDVVIVGGGVAGCAAVYYLAKAGVRATLVEREGVGTQASGVSAGGVNPLHGVPEALRPLAMESYRLHRGLWDELRQATGKDCGGRLSTIVRAVYEQAERPELEVVRETFEATPGFSARWLDPAEVRALEPRLTRDLIGALTLHGNGVVDSYRLTALLAEAAEKRGATIRPGEVCGLDRAGGRAARVLLTDGAIACDAVVLAVGPWAKAAGAWLGVSIPVEPLKGEILRMRLPGAALSHDVNAADVLLMNRAGGQVWCGSTTEWRGFDKAPSEAVRRLLLERAARLMPAMAEAELVEHTVGLRPVASDWLPIIGKAPSWDNVYLATGGAKKGILLGPAMGKALADLITAGSTPLSIAPFGLERFAHVAV